MSESSAVSMHDVYMESRKKLTMTGINDVESFDEEVVVAQSDCGIVTVKGQNLKISRLSVESGDMTVEGNIDSIVYSMDKHQEGFFQQGVQVMDYTPTFQQQLTGFVYSAGLGFCLGILYDFIKTIFYLLTGSDKMLVVVRDIIFLSLVTFADFIFLLIFCSGRMMLYCFTGEVLGLIVYFKTVSINLMPVMKSLTLKTRGFFQHFIRRFADIFLKVKKSSEKVIDLIKKSKKFFKST